jgi:colicin import membrane protein
MSTAAVFEERDEPGRLASALLAAATHLLLLLVLVFGVRWQNRPPESVAVELWEPPPATVVEAPKPPPPQAEPPKAESVVPKPEIAVKAPEKPKPVPKAPPKVEPKPAPKADPSKARADEAQKRMREELAKEQASLAIDRERQQIRDQLEREAAAASSKALATWIDRIRQHIRSRIRVDVAQAVAGNPEAIFTVTLLPSYEVLKVAKQKSSGNAAYDEEVERAILKSSPLPRPDRPELFSRELKLTFRPKD